MQPTALCLVLGGFELFPLVLAVSLSVHPNRSQFFVRESFTLSCDVKGNPSDWRVKKERNGLVEDVCTPSGPECWLDVVYPIDTGDYWCESEAGELSDALSIAVTEGAVILDSPALPVTEGETVTLLCRTRNSSSSPPTSSSLPSDFYKDDLLVGFSPTGVLRIRHVSRSDEGLYKCNVSEAGESSLSRLTVRGRPETTTTPLVTSVLLPVFGVCLAIAALMLLLCLSGRCKGEADRAVSYTDVTFSQEGAARTLADLDSGPTFYSTLNLESL